jgi:hypothetical protein
MIVIEFISSSNKNKNSFSLHPLVVIIMSNSALQDDHPRNNLFQAQ